MFCHWKRENIQSVFCQAIFPNFTFRIPSNHRGEFPVFGGIVCGWDNRSSLCGFRTSHSMEPSRQSLSAYHRNQIDATGNGGSYADSEEADFSISDVHHSSFIVCCLRNRLPGAFPWFDQLFTAGRLEQDGPYDGPDWGFFSSP